MQKGGTTPGHSYQKMRSRNELIGMALRYALDNMEIKEKE